MSMSDKRLTGFWEAVRGQSEGRFQPAQVRRVLEVTSVRQDSTGAVIEASGPLRGQGGNFTVNARGKGVKVGMSVGVFMERDNPFSALTFDAIDFSDDPTAGYSNVNPDLPPPDFAAIPFTTTIIYGVNDIVSRMSVYFIPVSEKFKPKEYIVSWRYIAGQWNDLRVLHLGGAQQECSLGTSFVPGVHVEVKLRTYYAWCDSYSVASQPLREFVAAVDNATPGAPDIGLDVSVGTPGQITLTAHGSVPPTTFKGWRYELATSPVGDDLIYSPPLNSNWTVPVSAGNKYTAVTPVSNSGVLGNRFPVSGFTGPWLVVAYGPSDTQPPDAWTVAPAVTDVSFIDGQGVWHGRVRITLPAGYPFGSPNNVDYAYTLVRIRNITSGMVYFPRIEGQSLGPTELDVASGGFAGSQTITVDAVGVDKTGNRQVGYGPSNSVTLTVPGLPTGVLTVTVVQRALGLLVEWSGVTGATYFEVWRSASPTGSSPSLVGKRVEGWFYADTLGTDTVVLPAYYYQVRSFNNAGGGPISQATWPGSATLPVDGRNIRLGSVTADQLLADQATFNAIMSGKVMTTKLVTANSGPRWELEGETSDTTTKAALRWFDSSGWIRIKLDTTGLGIFSPGNWTRSLFYNNGVFMYQDNNNVIRSSFMGDGFRMYQNDGSHTRVNVLGDGMRIYADGSDAQRASFLGDGVRIFKDGGGALSMFLGATGLTFYDDAQRWALRTGQSGGFGYLESAGGFMIRGDYTSLDLSQAQFMHWGFVQPDSAGTFNGHIYLCRVHNSPGATAGFGLLGYHLTPGGYTPYRFIFGYSLDPLNASNNLPASYVEINSGGSLIATSSVITQRIYLGPSTNHALTFNDSSGTFDFDAGIRQSNTDGSAWKLLHSGAGGNTHLDNSHNSMYYGWFSNPGGNHHFARGGGVYGTIAYATLAPQSSAMVKEDIGDAPADLGERMARVAPRAFFRKGHGRQRREIGFIAEEMREAIPEAIVPIPGGPMSEEEPTEYFPDTLGIDPMVLTATLWQRVVQQDGIMARLAERLAKLEAAGAA